MYGPSSRKRQYRRSFRQATKDSGLESWHLSFSMYCRSDVILSLMSYISGYREYYQY
ncbi:hypothetical protein BDV41DRAFT_530486 [Aspergillus transmontanensis]|uniref:Uncharacterized protein n=1 Tax=Aspergillus transmontanensis TaxID=1034304 RepID=A0A5N6W4A6_9EURO|nr:hypothetical protein BDV41DRAFT_530486 [Aspergillus transmontanensis]